MTDTKTDTDATLDLVASAEFDYDQAPEYRIAWGDALGFVRREYLNRAARGLDALRAAGRLLPEGGKRRTEYAVRVDRPHPRRSEKAGAIMGPWAEANARHAPTIWDGWATLQRTVIRWPNGSSYTGPWVEVEPGEAEREAA